MMKVLITGATGFVGANVARRFLDSGNEVHILARKTSDKWRVAGILKDITCHTADLKDYATLEKTVKDIRPEVIVHAAVYGGYAGQTDTQKMIETNITGTINLLKACGKTGYDSFINTGSSSEYGIKGHPMKEKDILEPVGEYGITKAAATLYCQMIAKKEDRPITTLRLFSPYGYYDDPTRFIPYAITSCLAGKKPKLSNPTYVRDYVFIEDVTDAYLKAAGCKTSLKGEIINIGSGDQYTLEGVAKRIIKLTGKKIEPSWGNPPARKEEPKTWKADITKAGKILDWKPRHNLEEGLKKTVKWFEENLAMYPEGG